MFNSMKEFYADYHEMVVTPEKAFYKKHWVGVVLINVVPITVLFMVPTICESVVQMKDKLTSKKNNETKEEVESK